MDTHPITRQTKRHGFSLIEAAIILGVVGLVVGGIWAAAASLSYHLQKQRFFQGLLSIQRLSDKYLSQSLPCAINSMYPFSSGSYLKFTNKTLYRLLIPEEWKEIDFSRFIRSDLGTSGTGMMTQVACDANGTRYYNVALYFQKASMCHETFNYLKARNILVGSPTNRAGENRCDDGWIAFAIAYTISRRS